MHSASLLHRDMKPSNLLLNSDCLMKVADFGLARSLREREPEDKPDPVVLTDYVATRWCARDSSTVAPAAARAARPFAGTSANERVRPRCRYRAPEILLGATNYGFGVDMWSVGCILGEMLHGKPIFPGQSTMNQLEKIMELTGASANRRSVATEPRHARWQGEEHATHDARPPHAVRRSAGMPTEETTARISKFAPNMLEAARSKDLPSEDEDPRVTEARFRKYFPTASDDALDLLVQLLRLDPERRISAEACLQHAYVAQFHDPNAEREAGRTVQTAIDDDKKLSTAVYRERLYHDITKMKRLREQVLREQQQQVPSSVSAGAGQPAAP
jgi:mitogen-activated protein kinase 15